MLPGTVPWAWALGSGSRGLSLQRQGTPPSATARLVVRGERIRFVRDFLVRERKDGLRGRQQVGDLDRVRVRRVS